MTAVVVLSDSDVGARRSDAEVVDGLEQFAVVVDTGVGAGFLRLQSDWRTSAELRSYAVRINEAADWLEAP